MHKRFSLNELTSIKNDFIPHLYSIIKKERCQGVNDFFNKVCFAQGNEAYYYKSSDCIFHMAKRDNVLTLIDEVDKIEVVLPFDKKSELQTLLMRFIAKKERQVWQKTIEQILGDEFKTGKYDQILGKPYLVYDIETTVADDIRSAKFIIAYAASPEPVAEGDTNMKYECVMIEDLKDFVDKMLAFDGYIVGFNQIWFDNPVSLWNAGYGEREIEILNNKSIDLYVFFQNLTKKRIWLNKLSEALIGLEKTLESGTKAEVLWNEYQKDPQKNKKSLEELQKYCKNDVRMTAMVMLYFLHYKKIAIEGEVFEYSLEEFVQKSNHNWVQEPTQEHSLQNQSIFSL